MNTQHAPVPWKVLPCASPALAEKHLFHANRHIATANAEWGLSNDMDSWELESGSIICDMRDGTPANAELIVRAVNSHEELVEALEIARAYVESYFESPEHKEQNGDLVFINSVLASIRAESSK